MKAVLTTFSKVSSCETSCLKTAVGQPIVQSHPPYNDAHQIEATGEKLRGMMPWISAGKMVDKEKN